MRGNSEIESEVINPHDASINDEVNKDIREQPKGKFLFFSTCSPKSLMTGIEIELNMSYNPSQCKKELMEVIKKNYVQDITSMDLLIYLGCGIPFLGGTLGDFFNQKLLKVKKYIYGIYTRQFPSNILEQKYLMLCDVTDDIHKNLISPICDSSIKGYCDMACLLGYLNNFGLKTDKLIACSAATIHFPPLITSLYRVKEQNDVTGFDIVTICSTFHTYFHYLVKSTVKPENVFEYALRCCNLITQIKNIPDSLPILSIDTSKNVYLQHLKQPKITYLWKADINEDFQYVKLDPFDSKVIEDANKSFGYFTPIAPLSIRIATGCSIVRGKDHSFLYMNQSFIKGSTDFVDIVDPLNCGKIEKYDLDIFAQSQRDSTFDNVVNLIDPDKVEQVIMVCLDQSRSMNRDFQGRRPNNDIPSRSIIATQYLTSFVNKTYGNRIPCILGLVGFNSMLYYLCPLSPLIPDFEEIGLNGILTFGQTKLWDAISFACDELMKFTRDDDGKPIFKDANGKEAKNRIIVISNGDDTASSSNSVKAVQKLLEKKIILDSVIINEEPVCKELAVISHITGGVAMNAKTISEGINIFELSAFQNLKERECSLKEIIKGDKSTRPTELKLSQITEKFISDAIQCVEFDTEIINKNINDAQNNTCLATPDHICTKKDPKTTNNPRNKRIIRELHYVSLVMTEELESYDPDLVVYPDSTDISKWQVYLKSPVDTPYMGKWFFMLVTFPPQYPVEAPVFQFVSVPYSLNVSDEGRICMEILEKGYIASFHVVDILQQIKSIFLIQNLDYPISIEKMELFKYNHDKYEEKVQQSALKVGKDDYHDFFPKNTIIQSNICDNYESVLIYELNDPSFMKSQISGRVIKDPVMPPSVGVLYERDELKKLIASSKNPTCVITGLPITETLEQVDQLAHYCLYQLA